jgi:hypothetical protein
MATRWGRYLIDFEEGTKVGELFDRLQFLAARRQWARTSQDGEQRYQRNMVDSPAILDRSSAMNGRHGDTDRNSKARA